VFHCNSNQSMKYHARFRSFIMVIQSGPKPAFMKQWDPWMNFLEVSIYYCIKQGWWRQGRQSVILQDFPNMARVEVIVVWASSLPWMSDLSLRIVVRLPTMERSLLWRVDGVVTVNSFILIDSVRCSAAYSSSEIWY
jgi:hypothetical protein